MDVPTDRPDTAVQPRRLAGDTFVFGSITNSGYTNGVLIDTGPEPEAYAGWPISDVLITHGHANQAIAALSRDAGLSDNAPQYWLAVTTVKAYLSDLVRDGSAEFFVRDHTGWWRAV